LSRHPDPHAKPTERPEAFDRFPAAGRAALDLRPDNIVFIGDVADVPSLAFHAGSKLMGGEGGTRAMEGACVDDDLSALDEALTAFLAPIHRHNERARAARHREREYHPLVFFCEGNHENRVLTLLEKQPSLRKSIRLPQSIVEKHGVNWIPFLEDLEIAGTLFSHYQPSGTMRKACPVNRIIPNIGRSAVVGHSHTWGMDVRPRKGSLPQMALSVGCYLPPERVPFGAWSGLALLTDMSEGTYNVQQLPYDFVISSYGYEAYAQKVRRKRAQVARDKEDIQLAFGGEFQ
jgi:hypothetical protein